MAYTLADADTFIEEANKRGANWPTDDEDFRQAVYTWIKHESGPAYNPLGVMHGGEAGGLRRYASTEAGLAGAASNLLTLAKNKSYGYDVVVWAGQQGDAQLFLSALARSSWSATRYGLTNINYQSGSAGGSNNLVALYNRLFNPDIKDIAVGRDKSTRPNLSSIPAEIDAGEFGQTPNDPKAGNGGFDLFGIGTAIQDTFTWVGFLLLGLVLIGGGIFLLSRNSGEQTA